MIFSLLIIFGILTAVIGKVFFVIDEDQKVSVVWPVTFDDAYVSKAADSIDYSIPEVYEMVQVITALAMLETDREFVNILDEGNYYKEVIEQFAEFKDHSAVRKMKKINGYSRIRTVFLYEFAADGYTLKSSGNFSNKYLTNYFADFIDLFEDFAQKTNFHQFYVEHEAFYSNCIDVYQQYVPVENVWRWLEERSQIHHDSYKIVLSPLIHGSHNTYTFRDSRKNFSEIVMFLSAPNAYNAKDESIEGWEPKKDDIANMTRNLFTEVDHNYVNPITNEDENIRKVFRYFSDLEKWNKKGGYQRPALTFNEYMTWGVYLLFAYDTYDEDLFNRQFESTIRLMDYRGFVQFDSFSNQLLDVYSEQNGSVILSSLYPPLLAWSKKQ